METVLYTVKPSNLPSNVPLFQPVVEVLHTQDVDKVSGVIAQKLGYEKMVVSHVLQNLGISLPELLAAGTIDLGFITMAMGMTGTVTDPSVVYNASNAPLTIRVALKKKSAIVESLRPLIGLQKNPYVPKTPNFTGVIASRYDVEGFVPVSSSYAITGLNISLTGKNLYAYTSTTWDWSEGDGTAYLFDDVVSGTNTKIAVNNPYDISKTYNAYAFIKFSLWNETLAEGVTSPTYRLVYGGLELLPVVADPDFKYEDANITSSFSLSIDIDGDLVIQWLSINPESPGLYGPPVKITEEQVEIDLADSQTPITATISMWIGAGAIDKYKALVQTTEANSIVITGFRE